MIAHPNFPYLLNSQKYKTNTGAIPKLTKSVNESNSFPNSDVPLINLAILPSKASRIAANKINVTKIEETQEWKNNFFEGIPSPAGGLLILMPLIYELTNLNFDLDIKSITPYLTTIVAILLVSKIPTLALKKISISSKTSMFLLLAIGIIFIALLFYTLETLLAFGAFYLLSIPLSIYFYNNQNKKNSQKISDDDHEDVL